MLSPSSPASSRPLSNPGADDGHGDRRISVGASSGGKSDRCDVPAFDFAEAALCVFLKLSLHPLRLYALINISGHIDITAGACKDRVRKLTKDYRRHRTQCKLGSKLLVPIYDNQRPRQAT